MKFQVLQSHLQNGKTRIFGDLQLRNIDYKTYVLDENAEEGADLSQNGRF